MSNIKVIEIKKSVFDSNANLGNEIRLENKMKKTLFVNLMASPGAGKTTMLTSLVNSLKHDYKIAIIEADCSSSVDALKIHDATGVTSIQINNDGQCHMDSFMTKKGLDLLSNDHYDLIILENIGNLVCPAEFDTGASKNIMILSVPEGDDKPLKYPLMFTVTDLVIISKMDTLDYFEEFSLERCIENVHLINPLSEIIPISAKTGMGMDSLINYFKEEIQKWRNE